MLQSLARKPESVLCDADMHAENIPGIFCWTKMGTEAGQPLDAILRRKELERRAGGGTFAWGIGSSLGNSVNLAREAAPDGIIDVLFTPMKSAPKVSDVAPSELLLWLSYYSENGQIADLPAHMLVTSRGGSNKRTHYALFCRSPIGLDRGRAGGSFGASAVRNLASLNPVGASQVTSIVRYERRLDGAEKPYKVAFMAKLHDEGFVRLAHPVPVTDSLMTLYVQLCQARTVDEWNEGIQAMRVIAVGRIENAQRNFFLNELGDRTALSKCCDRP